MKIKTNLHFHTADDPEDLIQYTFEEGIDRAASLGFGALALTCHNFFAWRKEYDAYARSKGIILIPGIELSIKTGDNFHGRHTVVLNCTKEAEQIRTFADLAEYKSKHPEIFVLAPHPYHSKERCLNDYLEKNIKLFDAIEWSWFYSRLFNRNRRAERIARKYNLPYIATSDTHMFDFINESYAVVESDERSARAVLRAIREGNFTNASSPRKFFKDLIWAYLYKRIFVNNILKRDLGLFQDKKLPPSFS